MWQTVTVFTYSRDRHGDRTRTGERQIHRCAFGPTPTDEDNDNKAQTTREGSLYLPPGEILTMTETVELPDGTQWEVVGEAIQYHSPFGNWKPGGEVRLRRVTG